MNPIIYGQRVRRSALEVVGDTIASGVRAVVRLPESVAYALSGDSSGLDRATTWTLFAAIAVLGLAAVVAQLWLRFGPR